MWEGEMCHQISIILTHGENDLVRFIVSGVVFIPFSFFFLLMSICFYIKVEV